MGYILVVGIVFLVDFFIKKKVDEKRKLGEISTVLRDKIMIRKYYNKGMMLDSLEKWPCLVRILCGAVLAFAGVMLFLLCREKGKRGMKLGLAMIIGGGASNFYDRLTKGYVIDYFSIKCRFPKLQRIVFNISDWFIFLGSLLLLLFRKK